MFTLRAKILLGLGAVTVLCLGATQGILQGLVLPGFAALERDQAIADLGRATEALRNEVVQVENFVGDWAGWDDTLRFVRTGDPAYVKSNLETNLFRADSFDFLAILRLDGTEVWRGGLAPDGAATPVGELPQGSWPEQHALLATRVIGESSTGIVLTRHGPLLLAAQPVTDSARKEPMAGWLVIGRFLNEDRIRAMAQRTRLDLWARATDTLQEQADLAALAALREGEPTLLVPRDEATLLGYALAPCLGGNGGVLLQVTMARSVLARGAATLELASLATVAAVVVLFTVLLVFLQWLVVGPLARLTAHVVAVRASDDLQARVGLARHDEVGVLAREFDTMLARLEASHERQVGDARAGGMSEVASAVLHDVGNALQGAMASVGLAGQQLASQTLQDLARVADLLAAHADDLGVWLTADPKGRKVPKFLALLGKQIGAEQAALRDEIAHVAEGLQHVQVLLAEQQVNAGHRGAIQRTDLAELFDAAVRLGLPPQCRETTVVRRCADLPQLHADKHRLLAVLVNLVRNAAQSIAAAGRRPGCIELGAALAGDGSMRLTVADDGLGIAGPDLERIFHGGLTTKTDGHGIGLHRSANAIRSMGGTLRADSAGPGRGATFTIELPLAQAVEAAT